MYHVTVRGEKMMYKRGNIMAKGRLFIWMFLVSGAFLISSAETSFCQLLFKPGMEQEYYGKTGYNKYGRSIVSRSANPKYDEFGNFVMDGVRIFEWNEEKKSSASNILSDRYSTLYKTNYIDEGEYYRQYLNNLVVVNESSKNFSSRFIVGNEVRVYFSPLTLDMAAMNGVRWDTNFGDTNLTFVSSRADLPLWFARDNINDDIRQRLNPVYLTGAHVERKFGILNVAANYVNMYKSNSQSSRSYRSSSLISDIRDSVTGELSPDPEEVSYLVVKVEDGSQFDAGGPRIFDMQMIVEGVLRKDLLVGISRENWSDDFYKANLTTDPATGFYENVFMLNPRRVPHYTVFQKALNTTGASMPSNYLFFRRISNNPNVPSDPIVKDFSEYAESGKNYLEANGQDYLVFWFQIPKVQTVDSEGNSVEEPVSDVKFRALMGNDYKISISEIYKDSNYSSSGSEGARYFKTVKEAPGNIKDLSNLGWITFEYGTQTADMIMGIRVNTDIKGFNMQAEFNKNFNFHQYPTNLSKKYHDAAEAYYINVKKEFGKFKIGTEYFNIDPNYSTTFENMDPAYYAMQTIGYSSWVSEFQSNVDNGGGNEQQVTATSVAYMNNTMVMETVDDNDDKDRYPDFALYSGVRDMNGIFPGQDKNGDLRPDTNENDNLIPDYAEPFFLYNVDPDEYSFGDDLNQNHIIDNREDDDKPDYPYNKDTRGYHVFGSWGSEQGLRLTAGLVDYEQIAGGGNTEVKYGKLEYNKFIPFYANVNFATVIKKAKDTITDDVFRVSREYTSTLRDSTTYAYNLFYHSYGIIPEKYYDPLDYRDSYVSSSYFETKLFRVPNLTIGLKVIYDINHQNATSYQKKNDIMDRSQVLRADYRYYYRNLLIMPQVKFMNRKYTNNDKSDITLHEQYFYPILRAEYPLTFNTVLKFGMQGFPGLKINDKTVIPAMNSTVRNLVNDQLDYDTRDYVFMVTNRSLYNGYDFSLNFGYQVNWQELKGTVRAPLSNSSQVLFIRLIVGMEPVS